MLLVVVTKLCPVHSSSKTGRSFTEERLTALSNNLECRKKADITRYPQAVIRSDTAMRVMISLDSVLFSFHRIKLATSKMEPQMDAVLDAMARLALYAGTKNITESFIDLLSRQPFPHLSTNRSMLAWKCLVIVTCHVHVILTTLKCLSRHRLWSRHVWGQA